VVDGVDMGWGIDQQDGKVKGNPFDKAVLALDFKD